MFYTQRFSEPQLHFVSQGKWSQNLMKTDAGNILPRYMINAFYIYWSMQEELADYFLIDLIVEEAVRSVAHIREMIENIPPSMPHIELLVHNLNSEYDATVEQFLMKDTSLFKLTYKVPFYKETPDGKETLYGHICKVFENNQMCI